MLRRMRENIVRALKGRSPKIFCIGMNKTGTTTLRYTLQEHGFKVGDESVAQRYMEDYAVRDLSGLIRFCKGADAFQDAPFSCWHTFIILDQAFPGSKFILTERNNAEEWYGSLLRFHSKRFGKDGRVPTAEDLRNAKRGEGRSPYANFKLRFGVSDSNMYDKELLTDYYELHNRMVKDYFRFRNDLLVLNLEEEDSYRRFCRFLNLRPRLDDFPKTNVSGD